MNDVLAMILIDFMHRHGTFRSYSDVEIEYVVRFTVTGYLEDMPTADTAEVKWRISKDVIKYLEAGVKYERDHQNASA